jgi:hypothetical protein
LFDPVPLRAEIESALTDGRAKEQTFRNATVRLRYLPMMCERTPVSVGLVDLLHPVAAELLGREVLPGRSKGTRYLQATGFHRDSVHPIPSIGCVAYLEPLTARTGALRVASGSHADRGMALPNSGDGTLAIPTEPGDVIVFDEHLIHGTIGGGERTQWRIDFVVDPLDDVETRAVLTWFASSLPDECAEPGYDATRYPTYGAYWRGLDRPWVRRLQELGIHDLAKPSGEGPPS